MTHDELLTLIDERNGAHTLEYDNAPWFAIRAVVELHKPTSYNDCSHCHGLQDMGESYPCSTIQAIEKELQ